MRSDYELISQASALRQSHPSIQNATVSMRSFENRKYKGYLHLAPDWDHPLPRSILLGVRAGPDIRDAGQGRRTDDASGNLPALAPEITRRCDAFATRFAHLGRTIAVANQ